MEEIMDYYSRYKRTFDMLDYVKGVDGEPQLAYINPEEINGLTKILGNKNIPILWYERKSDKQGGQTFIALLPVSTLDVRVSGNGSNVEEAIKQLIPNLKKHPELVAAHMGFFNNPENYLEFVQGKQAKTK